jgi:hypothetical protein
VQNLFDLVGNNRVAIRDVTTENRHGLEGTNSGTTFIDVRFGKAARVQDFIFSTDDDFRIPGTFTDFFSPL